MFFNELPNNTSQQLPLIIVGFGFTPAQSALFNIAKPLWGSFLICVTAFMIYATELGVGWTCAFSYIPCFVGGLIMVSRPRGALLLGWTTLMMRTTGHSPMVEQDRPRGRNADFYLQAFLPLGLVLGWDDDGWIYEEAHGYVDAHRRCFDC